MRWLIDYLRYPFKGINEGRTDWQQSPAIILWALATGVWYIPLMLFLMAILVGSMWAMQELDLLTTMQPLPAE